MWKSICKFIEKLLSRKLIVFILATVALFTDHLDSEHWTAIACIYVGVQGYLDRIAQKNEAGFTP